MKFSYSLIKEIVPALPAKNKFAEEFALKSFEVESIIDDAIDIKITANRFSDASGHEGIAREASAIFGLNFIPLKTIAFKKHSNSLKVIIDKSEDCYRYIGLLAEIEQKRPLSLKIKKYLTTCGLKSINPIVDILNYVMIEMGQPMHAFDADKIKGNIIVRRAKNREKVITIDEEEYDLMSSDLVIADDEKILAIAGIKGSKAAEITKDTKNIIIESANFNPALIYQTSKRINLDTEAAKRYRHGLSSEKAKRAMERALKLLTDYGFLKKIISINDKYNIKEPAKFIKFNIDKFQKITGVNISKNQAMIILKKLGFKIKADLVEIPKERIDISIFEDLVEEVIRIYGFNEIKSSNPFISIIPIHNDPIIIFKEKIKKILSNIRFDEIISYSFGHYPNSRAILLNPISQDKAFMRNNLIQGLDEAIEKNKRLFDEIKIFEFGKVFDDFNKEHWSLAMAIKTNKSISSIRILRGSVEIMLQKIGISNPIFILKDGALILKINGDEVGEISVSSDATRAFFEVNAQKLLDYSEAEFEYAPISPYPSIIRDISFWADNSVLVSEILEIINEINPDNLHDVDLLDYYPDALQKRVGITLRLVFQSQSKTLRDDEVSAWMDKINHILISKKGVEIR